VPRIRMACIRISICACIATIDFQREKFTATQRSPPIFFSTDVRSSNLKLALTYFHKEVNFNEFDARIDPRIN
jgi:hypothetical protein